MRYLVLLARITCLGALFLAAPKLLAQRQPDCGGEEERPCHVLDKEFWNNGNGGACDRGLKLTISGRDRCINSMRRTDKPVLPPAVQWALRQERYVLGAGEPINRIGVVMSHNAFNNLADAYGWEPNQYYSMSTLMSNGVNGLELDAHYFSTEMRVCHGLSSGAGCAPWDRIWPNVMKELRDWLDANTREIIVVFIQDETDAKNPHDDWFNEPFQAYLDKHVYKKEKIPATCGGEVACRFPTVQEMLDKDRRILFFGKSSHNSTYIWDFGPDADYKNFEEDAKNWSTSDQTACTTHWTGAALPPALNTSTKLFESQISGFGVFDEGGPALEPAGVAAGLRCGFSTIGLDYLFADKTLAPLSSVVLIPVRYLPVARDDEPRLEAAVWSFAAGTDPKTTAYATARPSDGRWVAATPSEVHPYACTHQRTGDPSSWTVDPHGAEWKVTAATGTYAGGSEDPCRKEFGGDYVFWRPANAYQNEKLRAGIKGSGNVWVKWTNPDVPSDLVLSPPTIDYVITPDAPPDDTTLSATTRLFERQISVSVQFATEGNGFLDKLCHETPWLTATAQSATVKPGGSGAVITLHFLPEVIRDLHTRPGLCNRSNRYTATVTVRDTSKSSVLAKATVKLTLREQTAITIEGVSNGTSTNTLRVRSTQALTSETAMRLMDRYTTTINGETYTDVRELASHPSATVVDFPPAEWLSAILRDPGPHELFADYPGGDQYAPARSSSISFNTGSKVTIVANPNWWPTDAWGLAFSVDGYDYQRTGDFYWMRGTSHTLNVADQTYSMMSLFSTQPSRFDVRFTFTGWSDGVLTPSRSYVVPSQDSTLTAVFEPRVLLSAAANPPGSGTFVKSPQQSNEYYTLGSLVTVTAVPQPGFRFLFFETPQPVFQNPVAHTMNGPQSVTANFIPTGPPLMVASIVDRTDAGGGNRDWKLRLTNVGSGGATAARITGLKITQTAGAACSPSVPPVLLYLGAIPAGSRAESAVRLGFSGCPATAVFSAVISFDANGGTYTGSTTLNNLYR